MSASSVDRANAALDTLAPTGTERMALDDALTPGIFLSFDPEAAVKDRRVTTSVTEMLALRYAPVQAARWATLNIELGNESLEPARLLGFALRFVADHDFPLRAAVRSFRGGAESDTPFEIMTTQYADHATACSVLWLDHAPDLIRPADWRILIFFFDPSGFEISIRDLVLL